MSPSPRGKRLRLRAILLAVCALGLCAAAAVYMGGYARAGVESAACMNGAASDADGVVTFGSPEAETGFVLYPGGRVDRNAYAPLAALLADGGLFVAIPEMPLHLAVFDADAAQQLSERFGGISRWYIGGHSLGGVMAASFAADHPDEVAGLVLLAAYAIKPVTVPALSVYGSLDTVLSRDKYQEGLSLLTGGCTEVVLDGGNHAQFGDYGAQAGDTTAALDAGEQRRQTADAILAFIARTSAKGG